MGIETSRKAGDGSLTEGRGWMWVCWGYHDFWKVDADFESSHD